MNCEICEKDVGHVMVVLPIRQVDGKLNTLTCLECAQKSGAYCDKHHRPHMGFAGDDTTACALCIEEMVAAEEGRGKEIFLAVKNGLPVRELQTLLSWADYSKLVTDELNYFKPCLRALATKACRTGQSIDEVLAGLLERRSVDLILASVV